MVAPAPHFSYMRKPPLTALLSVALGVMGCALISPAYAQTYTYNVSQDTSALTSGDQYAVDLQLNQGDANSSSINVSNFLYGGVGPTAGNIIDNQTGTTITDPQTSSQSVLFDNSNPNAEFTQEFSGGPLGFTVNYSGLSATAAGAIPDEFIFNIIDTTQSGALITTTDPSGANALLTIMKNSDNSYSVNRYDIRAADVAATPELGTVTSLGLVMGLFGLGILRARGKEAKIKT